MISNREQKYLLSFITAFLIALILGAGIYQYLQKTDADKGINDVPDIEKNPIHPITPFANSIEDSKKDAFSWEWVKTQWAEMGIEYKHLVIVGVGVIAVGAWKNQKRVKESKKCFLENQSKLENLMNKQPFVENQKQVKESKKCFLENQSKLENLMNKQPFVENQKQVKENQIKQVHEKIKKEKNRIKKLTDRNISVENKQVLITRKKQKKTTMERELEKKKPQIEQKEQQIQPVKPQIEKEQLERKINELEKKQQEKIKKTDNLGKLMTKWSGDMEDMDEMRKDLEIMKNIAKPEKHTIHQEIRKVKKELLMSNSLTQTEIERLLDKCIDLQTLVNSWYDKVKANKDKVEWKITEMQILIEFGENVKGKEEIRELKKMIRELKEAMELKEMRKWNEEEMRKWNEEEMSKMMKIEKTLKDKCVKLKNWIMKHKIEMEGLERLEQKSDDAVKNIQNDIDQLYAEEKEQKQNDMEQWNRKQNDIEQLYAEEEEQKQNDMEQLHAEEEQNHIIEQLHVEELHYAKEKGTEAERIR